MFAKVNDKKMSEFRDMDNWKTAKQIAKELGVTSRTVNSYWNNLFRDTVFDVNAKVSPEKEVILRESIQPKKAKRIAKKNFNPKQRQTPPAPDNPETEPARTFSWPTVASVRTALFNILAVGVVVGHGFLIWQEAQQLYGWLGSVGGAVVFTVICLAVLICSDPAKNRTSEWALWFICLVDIAAGRVHFEALSRPDVPADITVGFCVFICACSFMALLLFRDSKLS